MRVGLHVGVQGFCLELLFVRVNTLNDAAEVVAVVVCDATGMVHHRLSGEMRPYPGVNGRGTPQSSKPLLIFQSTGLIAAACTCSMGH